MFRPPELYQWKAQIPKHFPDLSQPVVPGLALWSLGMIVVHACSLTAIALWWSCLGQSFATVRERLRDAYREAGAKAGAHRRQLDLDACWAPWWDWVLEGWRGTLVAVVLDAASLGQRLVVLTASVLYRGCAVPVAWKILPRHEKHPWPMRQNRQTSRIGGHLFMACLGLQFPTAFPVRPDVDLQGIAANLAILDQPALHAGF